MAVFAIRPDDEAGRFVSPSLSLHEGERTRWEAEAWSPFGALEVGSDGRLTEAERARFLDLTVLIKTRRKSLPNVMGFNSLSPKTIVIVSAPMRDAIEALDPDAFDFIRLQKLFNKDSPEELTTDAELYLARPLAIVDALDKEASDLDTQISEAPGFFPRQFNGPNRVFIETRLPTRHYFRDATTGEGICTDAFRAAVKSVGCDGWLFYDCTLTGQQPESRA